MALNLKHRAAAAQPQSAEAKRKKRKKTISLAILALCAVLIIAYFIKPKTNNGAESVSYAYYTVEKRDIVQSISAAGTLSAAESYSVTSLVSGEITSCSFSEGDQVKKGQTLYKIDYSAISSEIKQAKLNLANTKSAYEKAVAKRADYVVSAPCSGSIVSINLLAGANVKAGDVIGTMLNESNEVCDITALCEGTLTKINAAEGTSVAMGTKILTLTNDTLEKEISNAKSSYQNAKLSMEKLNNQLENYTITSPISGNVIEKDYKKGESIDQGRTMCIIYDLSYLTVTLNIDELDISSIQAGQTVNLTASAVADNTYTGKVTKVSIIGTTQNGVTTYPVTVRLDETDKLLPGMNVSATIILQSESDALCIPTSAVARGNIVLTNNTQDSNEEKSPLEGFCYKRIELGVNDSDYIQITSGLSEGDKVAVETEAAEESSGGIFGMLFGSRNQKSGRNDSAPPSGGYPAQGGVPSEGNTTRRPSGGEN